MRESRGLAAQVVRQVVAFKRREAKLEAQVNEESRRDAREEERPEREDIAPRRPNQ